MERILVVEDEHIVALDIKMHLQKYGYEVPATYPSGEEALAHIEEIGPVLVLMDIRLQGQLDGLETAELIKERYNIPVILLTAYADDQTIERAKASQPFAYLIKPFEERELRTAIVLALFRHQMEQELIRRERLFSTTLKSIGDGVVVCDTQGIIDFINPVALQILGLQQQQCLGQEYNSVVVVEQKPREDRSEEGAVQHYLLNADSEWVPVEYLLTPLVGDKGARSGTVAVFRDVSSRLRAEADLARSLEQFRQVQKMEAVSRLSGGIAHDFNNLLTVIMGYSRLIHQELKRVATDVAEDIGADLEGLDRAAQKSAILTRQLLTFSRRQVLQRKACDLNEIVVDLEKMFRRLVTENVRLYLSCRAKPATVLVDRGQMEQVLMNLVVNARDAMPGGGTLTVRTRNETVVGEMATQTGCVPEGDYAVLSVQDTGCGIQPQDLNRIFEPFFTTKDTGQGTGLGLSTVYGIVSQSEGHIQVSNAVGEGTSFNIYLPLTEQGVSEDAEEPGPRGTPGGNETLLLVEDDEAVRRMLARVLRDNGYTVIEAQNAGEALLIAEDPSNTLHMIVSDVVMPHVTGDRLVARIRSARPEIKALLISGYPESVSDEWSQQGWASLLLKPFELQTLLERVRSVLDT